MGIVGIIPLWGLLGLSLYGDCGDYPLIGIMGIIPLWGLWGLSLYGDHGYYGDMGILRQDMFLGAWGEPGLDVFVILLLFVVARRGPAS